jgi:hypothetical protein
VPGDAVERRVAPPREQRLHQPLLVLRTQLGDEGLRLVVPPLRRVVVGAERVAALARIDAFLRVVQERPLHVLEAGIGPLDLQRVILALHLRRAGHHALGGALQPRAGLRRRLALTAAEIGRRSLHPQERRLDRLRGDALLGVGRDPRHQ